MPRRTRSVSSAADVIYHVMNRGNCRMDVVQKPGDFAAFVTILEEGRQRVRMRILAYCLMNNHWHIVLWPRKAGDLSKFVQWISSTHSRRWREHRANVGEGHLYQSLP
jgi:putative transposase